MDYAKRIAPIAFDATGQFQAAAVASSMQFLASEMDQDLRSEVLSGLIQYFSLTIRREEGQDVR